MKEWQCSFVKQDGSNQTFFFVDAQWINEEHCKKEVEKIYGPVTDFKMAVYKNKVTVREEKKVELPDDLTVFYSDPVTEFENKIAAFFGAPYAVATDSATHAIELCLRYIDAEMIICPKRTYLSVPMLADKLDITLFWNSNEWQDYYMITNEEIESHNIYDAAVLWRRNSYIPGSLMCISFQYQKHLNIGRGGMILCQDKKSALQLKRLSYDGRLPNIPWRKQGDIKDVGFHYYLFPELAQIGLDKLQKAIDTPPKIWTSKDYPDISKYTCFNK